MNAEEGEQQPAKHGSSSKAGGTGGAPQHDAAVPAPIACEQCGAMGFPTTNAHGVACCPSCLTPIHAIPHSATDGGATDGGPMDDRPMDDRKGPTMVTADHPLADSILVAERAEIDEQHLQPPVAQPATSASATSAKPAHGARSPQTSASGSLPPAKRSPFAPQYDLREVAAKRKTPQPQHENLAATGGAVGAMTLGLLALPGALLTPASLVTVGLGFLMGLWGLASLHRKWAVLGMAINGVAGVVCLLHLVW